MLQLKNLTILLKNFDLKATLVGSIADWVGTSIFNGFFYSLVNVRLTARGLSPETIQKHYQLWSSDVNGFLYTLFFGLSFTFFGGYLAAKLSRTATLINSTLVGTISVLTSIIFVENIKQWDILFSLLFLIPASTLGGYYFLKQWTFNNNDKEPEEEQP